jgi:hypothetical protein
VGCRHTFSTRKATREEEGEKKNEGAKTKGSRRGGTDCAKKREREERRLS